jgi:hypothetical protein
MIAYIATSVLSNAGRYIVPDTGLQNQNHNRQHHQRTGCDGLLLYSAVHCLSRADARYGKPESASRRLRSHRILLMWGLI